jgi:hypothetical protein
MRRSLLMVLSAVLVLSCVGCNGGSDGGITAPSDTIAGAFILQEVNTVLDGQPLQLVPPAVSGTLVLTTDGRFSGNVSAPDFEIEEAAAGSYTVSGSTLRLVYDDGTVESWTISPDRNQISGTTTVEDVAISALWVRQ